MSPILSRACQQAVSAFFSSPLCFPEANQRESRMRLLLKTRYGFIVMKLAGKVAVITGAAKGIGRALALRFHQEQAIVVAVDIDAGVAVTANDLDGLGIQVDVTQESEIVALVERVTRKYGHVDVFCSNAGIMVEGGPEVPDAQWQRIFGVNLMAHVYAARAVLPGMLERGEGYFLQTVSAAGLLSQIGSAPYAVTKHAALAFAEWLSITYGDRGIKVSAICPQGVKTAMLHESDTGPARFLSDGAVTPEQVAEAAVQGIDAESFLILPHPEVGEYFRRKAADYDRWLRGMRRLQASMIPVKAKL
jgi:NAD(P)-dependent dehydrogenase (short-subunit alcohol dehydrogenase family)